MSEFFEPPPLPLEKHRRPIRPPWSGPPEGTLPGVVPLELLLARSDKAAVYVTHLAVYPAGFELEIQAAAAAGEEDEQLEFDHDLFGRHWPSPGRNRELPAELLRIGVQFADGSKATTTAGMPHHRQDQVPPGPVMWPLAGGGGGGRWHQGYWIWPLPKGGPLQLVCEWPAADIPLTRKQMDTKVILEAANRAQSIFPD